jgi:mono/diheme cytochrome c family protein
MAVVCGAVVAKPTKQSAQAALVARGKKLFIANQCLDCHRLAGKGAIEGIGLDGVGDLRTVQFLTAQLEDPEKHVRETLHNNSSMMVVPKFSKEEIRAVVAYLKTLKSPKAPATGGVHK